ncbi:MAG: leucine--tRNA ligase [Oligoflexales bacterium]
MSSAYEAQNISSIEKKWQNYWEKHETFRTEDMNSAKPKYYILDMFPYPSGSGLHVGHIEGYTATDIMARYKRMKGFNVLYAMGWDAFGLPAEQYAVKTGTHPRDTTKKNVDTYKDQMKAVGLSYDWSREINTTDPEYFKWTQWIFLKLFDEKLAYQSFAPVNWCPNLGTVLANEEVIDGRSEVGDHPVERRNIRQWMLKITEYARELLDGLDDLDWPTSTKDMQRNWIGYSKGARVRFEVQEHNTSFHVFTTRPDTLFGATFCVLAPEHPLVSQITTAKQRGSVESYTEQCSRQSERDRTAQTDKTGVFTGAFAINPVNNQPIPIYIASYVLMGYGEGAIMAVPAHDTRDHAFAKAYNIPIIRVLSGGPENIQEEAHTGDGELVDSDFLTGLNKETAIQKALDWLESHELGETHETWKLRDWVFSRQRYWGEPFPLVLNEKGEAQRVPDSELPVSLPDVEEFQPTGTPEPPLAKAEAWLDYAKGLTRETNIMPQWAGSCWYYLRFIDPKNQHQPWSPEAEKHWMPVDLYVGGVEHANLHLLYARFWHKVLYKLGLVSTPEPFKRLVHPGIVLGSNHEKMSKSRGNVVNPDSVAQEWGADTLRLFEMFLGPLEQVKPWNTSGITGVHRFLKRVWRLVVDEDNSLKPKNAVEKNKAILSELHKTIEKVSHDTEDMRYNTGIASMMELVNTIYKEGGLIAQDTASVLVRLLAPYAPHMCEELWSRLGNNDTIAYASWPEFDSSLIASDSMTLSVMVNGKLRATLDGPVDQTKDVWLESAKTEVAKHLDGKTIRREVFVPGKIINFVCS